MPDIFHDFPVRAPARRVFEAIATPAGLDAWWTKRAVGEPLAGATYELWFGPAYDWRARVRRVEPGRAFEFELTVADADWTGSMVAFDLEERSGVTHVRFAHRGWPEANAHFRTSSFCWAMYLRLLAKYCETGAIVPYEERLDA